MSRLVEAVFLDFDGVMVDSEPLHVAAWNTSLQAQGYSLSRLSTELQATMAGQKPIVIAEKMIDELELDMRPDELLAEKAVIFDRSVHTDLKLMPRVRSAVRSLYEARYPLAIVTSTDYAVDVTERFGIRSLFPVIVTGKDVPVGKGKPAPDPYLIAADKLGVDPTKSVGIEDTKTGIDSLNAAGVISVGYFNPNAVPQDLSKAITIIRSFRTVTPSFIERQVEKKVKMSKR